MHVYMHPGNLVFTFSHIACELIAPRTAHVSCGPSAADDDYILLPPLFKDTWVFGVFGNNMSSNTLIWATFLSKISLCVSAISGRVMLNMETFGGTEIRFMWFSPQHPTAQHTGNNSGRQLGWRCRAELDDSYVTQLDLRNCSLFIPFCLLLKGLFNY